jgi:endonuclease/exonuclease/phosphatase family metal-dependent hydrolase
MHIDYIMKVLTWNILASEWIDDETYHMVKKTIRCDANRRFKRIMQYIMEEDATVILLQEVMPYEYGKLDRILRDKYILTPLSRINWHKTKNNSGNVTLFKKTDFSEKDMQHHRLEFGIRTDCMYKNKACRVFNIHFSDVSIKYRYTQLNSIMPLLLETNIGIIGGDFNHQYSKNTRFYNIPNYTIHNTTCPTYYIERKMNIDNILSKGLTIAPQTTCPKYPDDIEKGIIEYGSDHLPVKIDLM